MLKHVVFFLEIRHWKYLKIIHENTIIEKTMYFLFLLTSETYNKAAATTQKEQTQVYYDLKIFE